MLALKADIIERDKKGGKTLEPSIADVDVIVWMK